MPDTDAPSDSDSSKGSENKPVGTTGPIIVDPGASIVTDEENKSISMTWDEQGKTLESVGCVIRVSELMDSMFGRKGENVSASEDPKERDEEAEESDEDFETRYTESIGPPSPECDTESFLENMDIPRELEEHNKPLKPGTPTVEMRPNETSCVSGTLAFSVPRHPPTLDVVKVGDINNDGCELYSGFEKESRATIDPLDRKASDLATIEELYLSFSGSNVKRLDIYEPPYDLLSKDYEPMVGFVGENYRIVMDISLFKPENIVVHVVSDRINVYARQKIASQVGDAVNELHKVYKVPQRVDHEKFIAHLLKPLQLLCICAPIRTAMRELVESIAPMET